VRDAAYRSTTKKARAQLHERFARWLEERAGARASEYDEIIGLHLERAHRYRADLGPLDDQGRALARHAAERLGTAGRRALRMRADVLGAVNLLERAASLLPAEDPARIQLLPDLGSALLFASDFQRADHVLGEAIELARAAGDPRTEWEASVERASLRVQAGLASPEEALDVAVRAVPVLEELGDDRTLAKAWRLAGFVQGFMLCRWEACREAAMNGLRHARQAGDMKQQGDNLIGLLFSLMLGPTPVEAAIEECERIRQATAAIPQARAGVLSVLGPLEARRGRFDVARQLMAESRAIHEELGYRLYETGSSLQYALIELLAGDPVAAELELRRVYEALTRIGRKHFLAAVAILLARALYLQGRYDEAEEFVRAGEEALFPNDVWAQITFRGTRAKLLAQRGALAEAEQAARAGVELSRETDALEIQAEALLDLAEVLFRAGRPAEAVPLVQEASSLFARKGNAVAVGRIEAAVREQSGQPAPAS
jgi:tetratricopeptide (TPR) repeat protein